MYLTIICEVTFLGVVIGFRERSCLERFWDTRLMRKDNVGLELGKKLIQILN